MGPQTEAGDLLHQLKYRMVGESFRDMCNRIAARLSDGPEHYHLLRDILLDMRFLPGGRIQTSIGTTKATTPYNCFVSGTIADAYVEGDGSIMQRAHEAAATMRMGGGIGYDFSTLRPRGELIAALQSQSTGPCSFMRIFNEIGLCTASSGHRRGAQMGILRVDHPDIEEFVLAKNNQDQLTGFNISVAITNEFMDAVAAGQTFRLNWGGRTYRTVDARSLWEMIMRSTWDWAEPGVVFLDQINALNNLSYCETIAATNPCSEQPLPPFGACLLGSFNLPRYLRTTGNTVAEPGWYFDWDQFEADIPHVVRAMDNVIDIARYPLAGQMREAQEKRRMGLGVTGLANAGEACGFPYGSPDFLNFEDYALGRLKNEAYRASAHLAKEKGSFSALRKDSYIASPFVRQLDEDIKNLIKRHGIRNSHLTSIAPTGTISFCADNVSSGLEPVWSLMATRPIQTPDGLQQFDIRDYGYEFLGVQGKPSSEVTVREHIDVLCIAQRHVDSAVSKTCNVGEDIAWEDFKGIYVMAYEQGAKSCSTFSLGGKRAGLLQAEPSDCASGKCDF